MSEFVGNAIRLEIGNVVPGEIDAPLLEIAADNFGVVLVFVSLAGDKGGARANRRNRLVSKRENTWLDNRGETQVFIGITSGREILTAGDYRPI
jgi:hypothetical protein